jgi:hypothetical protein
VRYIAYCFTTDLLYNWCIVQGNEMTKKVDRKQTSLRMSARGKDLLEQTAEKLGITQAAAIELAIRAFAQTNGVDPEEKK